MAYTDLSAVFVYKALITHQRMDQLGENDKVFNDLLTAVTDFANFLQFNNTKGIKGEIAAGSTYKSLVVLDASNVLQLGESGTEVRVPADPSNALGVATKQYVDAIQMLQTQAEVSGNSGTSGTLATVLSLSATTRGQVHAIYGLMAGASITLRLKITIDGVVVIDDTSPSTVAGDYNYLAPNGKVADSNSTEDSLVGHLINLRFNSSLLIEAATDNSTAVAVKVLYSKIP